MVRVGLVSESGGVRSAGADQRPGIMRGDDAAGERDIGDVAAIGVDPRVQCRRGTSELEPVTRAGG
jgi:hypothetical protein